MQLLAEITNIKSVPCSKRSCASKAEVLIKKQCKVQAPRRRHVVKSPTPPPGHAPPPILRERSMSSLPPPSELVTLRGIVKYSPYILEQGMQTLQSYTERNTSFVVQKSVVIQVYGHVFLVAWGYWRPAGLLEHPWAFLNKLFGGLC